MASYSDMSTEQNSAMPRKCCVFMFQSLSSPFVASEHFEGISPAPAAHQASDSTLGPCGHWEHFHLGWHHRIPLDISRFPDVRKAFFLSKWPSVFMHSSFSRCSGLQQHKDGPTASIWRLNPSSRIPCAKTKVDVAIANHKAMRS